MAGQCPLVREKSIFCSITKKDGGTEEIKSTLCQWGFTGITKT